MSAEELDRKQIEILRILSEHAEPIGSSIIQRELAKRGFLLSERTVRYHLKILEERGFVEGHERIGRRITEKGLEELTRALAYERMGSILTKYMSLAYKTTYSPDNNSGDVVANITVIDKSHAEEAIDLIRSLYENGLLPAPYYMIIEENEEYRGFSAPEGKIALLTVCNLTVDGILMKNGIPIFLKYGGLVQFLRRKPIRFVDVLDYEHTTIHPLEIFVYKRATSILNVLRTGSGMVPANMREIPAEAEEKTLEIINKLVRKGWSGILKIGRPNEPVLGIPVSLDRFGISMAGGITPAAAMVEKGIQVETFAPHCLANIKDMKKA